MSEDSTIGTVTWPDGRTVATLHVDRTWSVPGREWSEEALGLIYSDAYRGPQDGPFGAMALADLARDVGGTFEYRARPSLRPPDDTGTADTVRTLTPARAGKSGRVNFDEQAMRTFAAGLARHLASRFGLTYKDKPDA